MANVVKFDIEIPADEKDKIDLLEKLFETLKINNKRKIQNVDVSKENINSNRLEEFKKQFGHLKYKAMPTKEDLAEIRTKRYAQ